MDDASLNPHRRLRRRRQLEIERQALGKEDGAASAERRAAIDEELVNLSETLDSLVAHWQLEKDCIENFCSTKQQIEDTRTETERAERSGDLERAAELKYSTLPFPPRSRVHGSGTSKSHAHVNI